MIVNKFTNKLVTIVPVTLIDIISYIDYLFYNFKVLKLFARLCALYPLDSGCSKLEIFYDNFVWYYIQFNLWTALVATFTAMYKARSDLSSWLNSFSESIIFIEIILLMILYRLQRPHLQILLQIFDDLIKDPDDFKLLLIRQSARKHLKGFSTVAVLFTMLAVIYVYKSFSTKPIQFILSGYYPYTSNSMMLWIIVLYHQLTILLYVPSIFASDFIVTLFVHKVNYVIRFFILKTIFCLGALQLGVGVILLRVCMHIKAIKKYDKNPDIPAITRIQFLVIFAITISRIYIYAHCAEILTKSGSDLGFAVYSSRWYIQRHNMVLAKSMIICRCQKPLVISVAGIIPALGMGYLGRFLYLIFSYIIALQAITKNHHL
ncbi:hypothetical protein TSAR_016061 [Trichomalopsis sarcophagae]|uniref:Odorant receptor n=1 Tax=Trichomalopsis sarcophagae TaxID=543379 RepID=A0A232ETH3_9HYME|nr:hypothetical protein TSAR_016061 [Trichomalopsis sarcophagae]